MFQGEDLKRAKRVTLQSYIRVQELKLERAKTEQDRATLQSNIVKATADLAEIA